MWGKGGGLSLCLGHVQHTQYVCVCVGGGLPGVCFGKDNSFHETEVG